jgi:hypothetical protein
MDFKKLANSKSIDDKIKAASNPKCPAKIIDQIIMDEELSWNGPKGEALMGATAANPNTESGHLSNCWIATEIESNKLAILKNPNCPEELMDKGFESDSIDRKLAVLGNPSVFWENIFLKIIVDEPFGSKLIKAIFDRSDLKGYKIKSEHKESIDKIDNLLLSDNFDTGMELLNTLDDSDLSKGIVHHLVNYKVGLAENHEEWSEDDIETIIKKNDYSSGDEAEPDLFYKISTHPKTPEVWLEDFALSGNHDDESVYEIALKCSYESLLYELYKDDTKSAVIQNKNCPKNLLLKVVRKENVGSALIDEYFNHIHGVVSSELDKKTVEILRFKSNIADLVDKHSNESDDVWIKKSKLSSDDLGEDYFQAIYNDKNSKIRLAVVNNPFIPENILIKLVDDSNVHIQLAVLSHPKCSEEILKKASEKNEVYLDSRLRKAVALNSNCSKEIVDKLIKDEYRWVRRAAASHPNINKEEITKLIKSGDRYVLRGLAINPNCPEAESTSINDLLSDEEKYPIEFNEYTISAPNGFSIVEHKAGFVDFEDITQGIMEGEEWSDYVWSEWYNYDDLVANYGPVSFVEMVEFPDGSSCPLEFEDNTKPFEIKVGDKTIFEGREEAFLTSTTSWESGEFEFSTISLQNEFKVECLTASPDEEGENVIYRHYDYEDDESGESDFSEGELLTSETDSTDITLYVKSTEEGIQYCEEFEFIREELIQSKFKLEYPYSDEDGPKIRKWLEENYDTWW